MTVLTDDVEPVDVHERLRRAAAGCVDLPDGRVQLRRSRHWRQGQTPAHVSADCLLQRADHWRRTICVSQKHSLSYPSLCLSGGGAGGTISPSPKFLAVGKLSENNSLVWKFSSQNANFRAEKNPIWGKFGDRIGIWSTDNLLCRKLATSCPPTFLTYDPADLCLDSRSSLFLTHQSGVKFAIGERRNLTEAGPEICQDPLNFCVVFHIKYTNNILVALFVPLILANVLQIFGTASQLIPIFRRSLDLSIV